MQNNIPESQSELNMPAKEKLSLILDVLSITWLAKLLFHPFIEFNSELSAIRKGRHVEKSLFRIVGISLSAIAGIILFNNHQTTTEFFQKIIAAFNMPPTLTSIIAGFVGVLYFAHLGSYLSQIIAKLVCSLLFRDPDFYITKKQLNILKQKFKTQGYRNIKDTDILQVVDFCRINLRKKSPTKFLGDKPNDWLKTLETIIYDADLEHFLDQQQTLKRKTLQMKSFYLNFLKYYEDYQDKESIKLTEPYSPLTQTTSQSNQGISVVSSTNTTPRTTCFYTHKYPSLSSISKASSYSTSANSDKIAKYELNKFRNNALVDHNPAVSEESLIRNYKYYLRQKSLITDIAICPAHVIDNISTIIRSAPNCGTLFNYQALSQLRHNSTSEEDVTPKASSSRTAKASISIGNKEIILTLPTTTHCKPNI